MSSAKWRPFCLGLNVWSITTTGSTDGNSLRWNLLQGTLYNRLWRHHRGIKNEWDKEGLSVTIAIMIVTTLCVRTIAMTSQYLAKVSAGHVQPFMRIRHVRSSGDDDHEYYQNKWAHRYFIVNSITCGKLHHSGCMHYLLYLHGSADNILK